MPLTRSGDELGGSGRFRQRPRSGNVLPAPADQCENDLTQIAPFGRQRVRVTNGTVLIGLARDDARVLETRQAIGKDVGGYSFGRLEDLSIGVSAMEQVADDEERPLVANEIQRARNRAGRTLLDRDLTSRAAWQLGLPR